MVFLQGKEDYRMRCYLCQCCCKGVADKIAESVQIRGTDQKREGLRKYHGLRLFEQPFRYVTLFLIYQLNPWTRCMYK